MNASLPLHYQPAHRIPPRETAAHKLNTLFHTIISLFAAPDDPAALRYMLRKNGESVD